MRLFGPSGSGTCHCPIQSYYLPVPRDLAATNQCTFHHKTCARPWKEITSGSLGQLPAEASKVGTKIWVTFPLKSLVLSWSRPLDVHFYWCIQTLGDAVFGVEKYKGCVQTKEVHSCPVISHFYWLRYICTRDSSMLQVYIYASLHLLYRHFFEEGQSASKKHLSEEHLKKKQLSDN